MNETVISAAEFERRQKLQKAPWRSVADLMKLEFPPVQWCVPGFLPELTPNPGPYFIESHYTRVDNPFTSTERVLSELSLRPDDFTAMLGVPADVAGILFTSTSWTKEPQ